MGISFISISFGRLFFFNLLYHIPCPRIQAAKSFECLPPRFIVMPLSADVDSFPSSPSILDIPKAHLSSMGLEPNDDDGDGRGWDPMMNTDSERGIWLPLPPRPLEGGTPTRRVGGVLALAMEAASSEEMMDSTSSMQISTLARSRVLDQCE